MLNPRDIAGNAEEECPAKPQQGQSSERRHTLLVESISIEHPDKPGQGQYPGGRHTGEELTTLQVELEGISFEHPDSQAKNSILRGDTLVRSWPRC